MSEDSSIFLTSGYIGRAIEGCVEEYVKECGGDCVKECRGECLEGCGGGRGEFREEDIRS